MDTPTETTNLTPADDDRAPHTIAAWQTDITAWADQAFPAHGSFLGLLTHLREEITELEHAHFQTDAALEIADCLILVLRIAERLSIDAQSALRDKMAINRARRWYRAPDGLVRHVPDGATQP